MQPPNPLITRVSEINSTGRIALCGYFLTGYESPKTFYSLVRSLEHIDIFEFGIPSENPFLDGPAISKAHDHVTGSLGLNAETALPLLGGLRDIPQPRFVMTYAKEGRDLDGFIRICLLNGIHGILAPDVNIEEAAHVSFLASSLNMAYIGFLHDGLDDASTRKTVELCDMVYLKISSGTTGQKGELDPSFLDKLQQRIVTLRQLKHNLILAAGIGIQTPGQIQTLSELDINMVVVGTSLMQKMASGLASLQTYTRMLRNATVRSSQDYQTVSALLIGAG